MLCKASDRLYVVDFYPYPIEQFADDAAVDRELQGDQV